MHKVLIVLTVVSVAFSSSAQSIKPILSKTPLSADAIAVYRAFFEWKSSDNRIDLDEITMPLGFSDPTDMKECVNGISGEELEAAVQTIHLLPRNVTKGTNFRPTSARRRLARIKSKTTELAEHGHRIKDKDEEFRKAFPSSLFSVSEVAFNPKHRLAVMDYRSVCGQLCGTGGTVAAQKENGVWKFSICTIAIF